ncbi:hypothetical protein TWF102_011712 [Orbilia oligospora]|uniref:Uncharacterized protein n=1 Tax=Orbilia oligospora TaxID=2813651 RepID=A0A7C8J8G9_ORBOL|nr:hypothetical protein TWF102_011712 [Orbilia oligospora]KAF3112987.1 hypothetical protein TWF706_009998 [Orbilia oligospora]
MHQAEFESTFTKTCIPVCQYDVEIDLPECDQILRRSLRGNLRVRFATILPAFLFLPSVLGSDTLLSTNGIPSNPTALGSTAFPGATDIAAMSIMGAPVQKEQCLCNLDHVSLETKPKQKPGDPFNGNSALLFAYAQTLANIAAPDMGITDSQMALYITPPFYPGIVVEQPDPVPLMNYQLWQYADGLLPTDYPVWDHDGGSYFEFYSGYLSYASDSDSVEPNPAARNNMLHLFGQLKTAAKAVDKAKLDAIATYKQAVLQATGPGEDLPQELRNLTIWLEENATYRISQQNLNEITQLYNHARTKSPGDLFYKPKYGLNADYVETASLWSEEYRINPNLKPIFTFSLDDLPTVNVDWTTLGFPNIEKGRGEDISPKDTILSLQTETQTLTPQVEEIVISATNLQTFSINRGDWDKPDFKKSFPRLRADAPIRFTAPIVRPCRFLFTYGVQIDVRIDEGNVREFAYELDKMATKSATLLGATRPLKMEGNVVSTKKDGDPDLGYPYLLAVLGERL